MGRPSFRLASAVWKPRDGVTHPQPKESSCRESDRRNSAELGGAENQGFVASATQHGFEPKATLLRPTSQAVAHAPRRGFFLRYYVFTE